MLRKKYFEILFAPSWYSILGIILTNFTTNLKTYVSWTDKLISLVGKLYKGSLVVQWLVGMFYDSYIGKDRRDIKEQHYIFKS